MAAGDLCTKEEVREFLQKQTAATEQNAVIDSLILRASDLIPTYCGREFINAAGATTRKFAMRHSGYCSLYPYDLRGNPTAVTIDSDTSTSTALTTTTPDYHLSPFPSKYGVYYALDIPGYTVRPGRRREVSVTGTWGFADTHAGIPAGVKHAAVITVVHWLRTGVQAFSSGFNPETDRFEIARVLPDGALASLAPFVRH